MPGPSAAKPVGEQDPDIVPSFAGGVGTFYLNPTSPYKMPVWQALWTRASGEVISSDSY